MALKTPRQIATKIKSLKKEVSLLEMAKKAASNAKRAIRTASISMRHGRNRKKSSGKKRRR